MIKTLIVYCLYILPGALFAQDAILKSNDSQEFSWTVVQMQNTKMAVADKNQDLTWNLIQMGNQNTISYKMSGENSFDFIQKGDGNRIDMTLPGENNFFKFEQLGNQNKLQLNEIMFRSGMLEVLQEGNGNALLESGGGLNFPMKIEQRGGMRIEINSIINGFQ
jgi:hypothetical protein